MGMYVACSLKDGRTFFQQITREPNHYTRYRVKEANRNTRGNFRRLSACLTETQDVAPTMDLRFILLRDYCTD